MHKEFTLHRVISVTSQLQKKTDCSWLLPLALVANQSFSAKLMKRRACLPSYLGRYAESGFQEQDLFRIAKEGGLSLWIYVLNTVVLSWLDWEFLSCVDFV